MDELNSTKNQKLVSINGSIYVLVSKKSKEFHNYLKEPLDSKKHLAVFEDVIVDGKKYSRFRFEEKPVEAKPNEGSP